MHATLAAVQGPGLFNLLRSEGMHPVAAERCYHRAITATDALTHVCRCMNAVRLPKVSNVIAVIDKEYPMTHVCHDMNVSVHLSTFPPQYYLFVAAYKKCPRNM